MELDKTPNDDPAAGETVADQIKDDEFQEDEYSHQNHGYYVNKAAFRVKCCGLCFCSDPITRGWAYGSVLISLVFTPPIVIVGLWGLIQTLTTHYPIVMEAAISVVIISSMLLILGIIMPLVFLFILNYLIVGLARNWYGKRQPAAFTVAAFLVISALIIIILGIASAGLTASISDRLQSSANNSLSNFLSDQTIQDSWNSAQESMQCCGVVAFTDYQRIFNNLSVPLSCCNTTAVTVNITCSDIVRNTPTSNSTGLIYTNGCASQLVPIYLLMLVIIGLVSIITGVVQIVGLMIQFYRFLTTIRC